MSKTLTYLFDPLCDWCYGINQALARLVESTGVALALLPSGQFSGNGARPMSTALAGHAWTNDLHIEQITGLPFSTRYRDRVLGSQQPLDSTLPTLALTAVSLTTPCREFDALQGLQHARYAGGQNVTDPAVVAALLEEMGLADAALGMQRPTDALQAAHRSRIDTARCPPSSSTTGRAVCARCRPACSLPSPCTLPGRSTVSPRTSWTTCCNRQRHITGAQGRFSFGPDPAVCCRRFPTCAAPCGLPPAQNARFVAFPRLRGTLSSTQIRSQRRNGPVHAARYRNSSANSSPKARLKAMLSSPGSMKLWLKMKRPMRVVPVVSKSMEAMIGP